MSELYDHIHEDRSEERPTASVWYNDDTRVKTFEIEDAHTLHPTGPDRKATEYKSFAERARGTTGRANSLHETMRYARTLDPDGWKTTSDSESDDDDNGRMEKLHTMMESVKSRRSVLWLRS
jgi:hypothetical protein